MNIENVKKAIETRRKGEFIKVIWGRQCKTKKAYANETIMKHCAVTARIGVTYDNIGNVKQKRENGELPENNQGLPWGTWVDGYFPYLIEHKGKYYVRISLANGNPVKVRYVDKEGNGCSFDKIEHMLLASEKPKKDSNPDVLTISIDNIMYIWNKGGNAFIFLYALLAITNIYNGL